MPDKSALRIVAIGGGTGLSTLLKGLKKYALPTGGLEPRPPVAQLTAVVTVTDDGGSSGRLRRAFDILPPGDIRNCHTLDERVEVTQIVALKRIYARILTDYFA